MNTWPTMLETNAWTGSSPAAGPLGPGAGRWSLDLRDRPESNLGNLAPPPEADRADWRDPDVGWGLVLADDARLSAADRASGADAPEPIRELLRSRPGSPVFRYQSGTPYSLTHLYHPASNKHIPIAEGPGGNKPGMPPRYLLIYGTPAVIPWDLQYVMHGLYAVGRLDLTGAALENYIAALMGEWRDSSAQIDHALAWAVVRGDQITPLMRNSIAAKVVEHWQTDATLRQGGISFLDGASTPATAPGLVTALQTERPALIVTTSHGQTGPLDDQALMAARLGALVDQQEAIVDPGALLAQWQPDGAIWYAHACCSAGSSDLTQFDGLVAPGSAIDRVLKGVSALGAQTAPLPQALLGAKKPLRAFVGHVEPTFDWTLRDPATGQYLTRRLREALYQQIYTAQPVGLAFTGWLAGGAAYAQDYDVALARFNQGDSAARTALLAYKLIARDRRATVILGDPTATLPKLP